ncbi:MAG: hypothetical protein PHD32_03155 [Eubacteriales bacterium]|nr:hypothetical protein [Eubacteriales bacterium]
MSKGLNIALRVGAAVLAVAIAAAIFMMATSFYGDPVRALRANKAINAHLAAVYGDRDDLQYARGKVEYDFKMGDYYKVVTSSDSEDTSFTVYYARGAVRDTFDSDVGERFNTIIRLNNALQDELEEMLRAEYSASVKNCMCDFDLEGKDTAALFQLDMPLDMKNLPCAVNLTVYLAQEEPAQEQLVERLTALDDWVRAKGIAVNSYSIELEQPGEEVDYSKSVILYDFPAEQVRRGDVAQLVREKMERDSLPDTKEPEVAPAAKDD